MFLRSRAVLWGHSLHCTTLRGDYKSNKLGFFGSERTPKGGKRGWPFIEEYDDESAQSAELDEERLAYEQDREPI